MLADAHRGDVQAGAVTALLRQVRPGQRFGMPQLWAQSAGQDAAAVGVKAGWGLSAGQDLLRTHVVVVGPQVSVAVVTGAVLTPRQRRWWPAELQAGGPEAVVAAHRRHAGPVLRDAVAAASASL